VSPLIFTVQLALSNLKASLDPLKLEGPRHITCSILAAQALSHLKTWKTRPAHT